MQIDRELSLAFKSGLDDLEAGLSEVLRLLQQVRAAGDTQAELRVMKVYCTLLSMARTTTTLKRPEVVQPLAK